ncbi:SDR family NAD(P)-dependent oxidoreductase [Microbispora sp. SCL1-1]|uniref:SDR family NAD(P)-dependent oxidoreductase n=1 Tax=Microbispora sp. SCL1-1 TaxID=2592812 RepID=UPI0037CB2924
MVSGAGRGIGAATALELGRLGYHVIVNYLRDADSAELVVKQIGAAQAVQADVTDEAQVTMLVPGGRRARADRRACGQRPHRGAAFRPAGACAVGGVRSQDQR